ncbi:MAG TPA: MlaD family protein [Solirubrobacterales bacterium]|nr:MlaD family protein [Solirubrobacterales bacterium]
MRSGEGRGLSNVAIGVIAAVILTIAAYLAFTKDVPWGGGTEFQVNFASAQNLRVNSPVRIAGVNVGTVTSVEPLAPGSGDGSSAEEGAEGEGAANPDTESAQAGATATIEISDEGLPLKEDARFSLRPRLFLEGNLFVDVNPGSPGAPEADPGTPFSPDQTRNSVQLDQILTGSLQQNSRQDLQLFLDQFGEALIDAGGAESFRTLYKASPGSFRATSQVNEAVLGENPHDLSNLIKNLDKVLRGLGRNKRALQDTITNFRIVAGSFAAEDAALERAIIELPQVLDAADPALANLNAAFPPLRAFSREILPGVRSGPETLDAAIPLIKQVRLLSRRSELRGLARDLVPTAPKLAKLAKRTPDFLEETRALSSCFNKVIIPWSLDEVEGPAGYPYPAVGEVYKETAYGLAGIAGESRSGDANGQYIRVAGGGGTNTPAVGPTITNVITTTSAEGEVFAGTSAFDLLGAVPGPGDSAKTPFKPSAPCENQETPDLRASAGAPPSQGPVPTSAAAGSGGGEPAKVLRDSEAITDQIEAFGAAKQAGDNREAKQIEKQIGKDARKFYKRHGN